ncbi:MAG: Gfo/Idh/MocA family oxidoreductase [Bacteroidota bacterium]
MNSRRKFLKLSAISAAFLGLPIKSSYSRNEIDNHLDAVLTNRQSKGKSVMNLTVEPIEQVGVGIIGMGNRGYSLMNQFIALSPKAKVLAICDIRDEKAEKAALRLKENGQNPAVYKGSATAWQKMVERDDLDLVIITTPWEDHVEMGVHAMKNGKHVGIEVPAAITLDECWALVNTAEETQRNCMMLENVCYGDEELWVLNMVHEGIFGTLTHAEAAYIHDLSEHLYSKTYYYNQWRIRHHIERDGNLYPTHGLGPVAQYLGISRGDRFDHIVSMSSRQAGLAENSLKVDHDNEFYNQQTFAHGDMNSSLIKTEMGRTILVQHDVITPRPYSRINALGGTKAYHEGYPSRLALESHKGGHRWLDEAAYSEMRTKFKHPIWESLEDEIEKNGGHGGMDFVMIYRLVDCLNRGLPLDMDVYDGVDWSVVSPLSKISVELGSIPVGFPDFTRGKWEGKRELGIMANI